MSTPESNPLDAASPLEPSQPLAVAAGSAEYREARIRWALEGINPRFHAKFRALAEEHPDASVFWDHDEGEASLEGDGYRIVISTWETPPNNPVSNAVSETEQQNGPSNGVAL